MIKYLIKTTEEYWQPDLGSVESFHKWLQEDGQKQGYQVCGFSYSEKPVKEGKEVIDTYFIVKVIKQFDDAKEPTEAPLNSITYDRGNDYRDAEEYFGDN